MCCVAFLRKKDDDVYAIKTSFIYRLLGEIAMVIVFAIALFVALVATIRKLERIEENKKIFGNSYNHKCDGYLFVHDNGNIIQPHYFTERFRKIIQRNGLKQITPHGLSHSIATLLHLEGVDIRDIRDWLGHENISSTNIYTRSIGGQLLCFYFLIFFKAQQIIYIFILP